MTMQWVNVNRVTIIFVCACGEEQEADLLTAIREEIPRCPNCGGKMEVQQECVID